MLSMAGLEQKDVEVRMGSVALRGDLRLPPSAGGIVLFAHGSGSSRRSPRNVQVAEVLNRAGLGTLLFDLLTKEEEADRGNVFDVGLLAERLVAATEWVRSDQATAALPVGYFGASTGAAAALAASVLDRRDRIGAIVSRGGRPDLAGDALGGVRAPTLLIVGGEDRDVLELNEQARRSMTCPTELVVVPGATHLFEEPGTLDRVAALARDWFLSHLR